jgi:hypothetical protein
MADMSEEEKRARDIEDALEKHDAAKKDAEENGSKIDKLLSCLDSLSKRMDSFETAMSDAKRKDSEIEERGDPKESSVDSRSDSIEHSNELAACQVMGDRADSAWSRTAPSPWTGESVDGYLRRLTRSHKSHSENWKDVDLGELRGQALKNAASEIFKDSIAKSCSPIEIGAGRLHEVRRRDPDSGHLIKEYYGDPMAWMQQFTGQKRTARFNLSGRRGGE